MSCIFNDKTHTLDIYIYIYINTFSFSRHNVFVIYFQIEENYSTDFELNLDRVDIFLWEDVYIQKLCKWC